MSSLNTCTLLGRMGKDPEYKTLQSGKGVCNFSIATSEKFKKQDGTVTETTTWHNLVLWDKVADIAAKYLHKGDMILVQGKITNRSWEKEGVTRYVTEIVVNNLVMVSTKRTDQPQSSAPPAAVGSLLDDDFGPGAPSTQAPPQQLAAKTPPLTQAELDADLPF